MTADRTALPASVAVLYDEQALTGDAASQDVLTQMAAVEDSLRRLGIHSTRLPVTLDLRAGKNRLLALRPDAVVNLVESLDGSDRLQTLVPLVLEDWGIPFTGSGSAAMLLSNHKLEAKKTLAAAGLPVAAAAWLAPDGSLRLFPEASGWRGDAIVKPVETHASLHMDDASVLRAPATAAVVDRLREERRRHGIEFFAEAYIEGREFNLSVVEAGENGLTVLPPAEIRFDGLPAGKPRIVGYAAKWDEDSPEYQGTVRSFRLGPEDGPLTAELSDLTLAAWSVLGLAGYGRIDFRVDASGRPFILEANANPCLSPDAGLAAAVEEAGHEFDWLVAAMLRATMVPSVGAVGSRSSVG
ncbi:MAG: D-alanine--D-alanine ligase [Planctomycetes bacterium]|nr:D-alanine--D-alanine ligase [Planctomycetota bacterium]